MPLFPQKKFGCPPPAGACGGLFAGLFQASGTEVTVHSHKPRLALANFPSSFHRIYSGCVGLALVTHHPEMLALVTRLLRPGGTLTMMQATDQVPDTLGAHIVWPACDKTSPQH